MPSNHVSQLLHSPDHTFTAIDLSGHLQEQRRLPATVIDQSNEVLSSSAGTVWTHIGQTFQAGITGPMTQIDFATSECGPRDATLNIYEGSHVSHPLPDPIHQQAVVLTEVACINRNSPVPVWSEFVLSSPVNVVTGASYTFKFVPTDQQWLSSPISTASGNSYPRGRSYVSASYDLLFRTHVVDVTIPTTTELESQWKIQEPVYELDENDRSFFIEYPHADVSATSAQQLLHVYQAGCEDLVNGLTAVPTYTDTSASLSLEFSDFVDYADIYSFDEDAGVGTVAFCVRFSLSTSSGTEVSTKIADFVLTLTLNGAISVDEFDLEEENFEATIDETISFTVTAGVCSNQEFPLLRGDSVSICVSSDAYPDVSLGGIQSFSFTNGNGDDEQVAIENEEPAELTSFNVADDCDGQICTFETILRSGYYDSEVALTEGMIGSGVAILEIPTGRRRVKVALRAEKEESAMKEYTGFELEFGIEASSASSGFSSSVASMFVSAIAVSAGLLALL
jgi:hypothetical protein